MSSFAAAPSHSYLTARQRKVEEKGRDKYTKEKMEDFWAKCRSIRKRMRRNEEHPLRQQAEKFNAKSERLWVQQPLVLFKPTRSWDDALVPDFAALRSESFLTWVIGNGNVLTRFFAIIGIVSYFISSDESEAALPSSYVSMACGVLVAILAFGLKAATIRQDMKLTRELRELDQEYAELEKELDRVDKQISKRKNNPDDKRVQKKTSGIQLNGTMQPTQANARFRKRDFSSADIVRNSRTNKTQRLRTALPS